MKPAKPNQYIHL